MKLTMNSLISRFLLLPEKSADWYQFSLSSLSLFFLYLDIYVYDFRVLGILQDAELPPIMEEEEPEIPLAFEQSGGGGGGPSVPVMEEFPRVATNEERALVLFKPMNTLLLHSPSNFSVSVDSDMISSFKSKNSTPNPFF